MPEWRLDDDVIGALAQIGNHKRVKKLCEPQIMEPLKLEKWMVKRTLISLELFEKEWKRNEAKQGQKTRKTSAKGSKNKKE